MLGTRLREAVEASTHGDVVDVKQLVKSLGAEIIYFDASTVEKGELASEVIEEEGDEQSDVVKSRYVFRLNSKNTDEENNTVLALLLAEFMLNYDIVSGGRKSNYPIDVFYLRSLRKIRTSRQVILATRLAMPKEVIEKAGEIDFDSFSYARKAQLMQSFVSCAYSDKSVMGILGMIESVELTHY